MDKSYKLALEQVWCNVQEENGEIEAVVSRGKTVVRTRQMSSTHVAVTCQLRGTLIVVSQRPLVSRLGAEVNKDRHTQCKEAMVATE